MEERKREREIERRESGRGNGTLRQCGIGFSLANGRLIFAPVASYETRSSLVSRSPDGKI